MDIRMSDGSANRAVDSSLSGNSAWLQMAAKSAVTLGQQADEHATSVGMFRHPCRLA
jgi:hypothetical protein